MVALQIRRGPRELGWYKVLDAQGEEHSQKSVLSALYRGNISSLQMYLEYTVGY